MSNISPLHRRPDSATSAATDSETHRGTELTEEGLTEEPWTVLLFDDPVNTMAYVAAALRAVLEVDAAAAEALMFEAHSNGKAPVYTGERSEAERVCVALHSWALHAAVAQ